MVQRKQVIPGDVIASGDYRYGPNVERRGEQLIALRVGTAEVSHEYGVKLNPLTGPYWPHAEDLVIGKVVDMSGFGWEVDINACFFGYLPASFVFGREFSPATHDLSTKFKVGDLMGARIESFERTRDPQLSIRGPGLGPITGGEIVKIAPSRVPRLIGKRGSMVNMISDRTGTDIKVGQNGYVVVEGSPEGKAKALEAVRMIDQGVQGPELARKVEEFLGGSESGAQE
jgi:exosome complex component RRP4